MWEGTVQLVMMEGLMLHPNWSEKKPHNTAAEVSSLIVPLRWSLAIIVVLLWQQVLSASLCVCVLRTSALPLCQCPCYCRSDILIILTSYVSVSWRKVQYMCFLLK